MIPTLKDWTAGTLKGFLNKRGTRLKALDSAIENYHKARSVPGLCLHLAKLKPDDAFNNADNYRLFAECCQFD